MPNCPSCQEHAKPDELRKVGDQLACSSCRTPKLVSGQEKIMVDDMELNQKQDTTQGKLVLDLRVREETREGSAPDYKVYASARLGNMTLSGSITVDDIRRFFTERRARAEAKKAL